MQKTFPIIDLIATGQNIMRLRKERGLSVRDLQAYFGFEQPQAIYKWQQGQSLPTVDNLYALSILLEVTVDEILVGSIPRQQKNKYEQQAKACCSSHIQKNILYFGAVQARQRKHRLDHFAFLRPYTKAQSSLPRFKNREESTRQSFFNPCPLNYI